MRAIVWAALAVTLGLVAAKLWATYRIGSSVMLSTLVHSLIDASAQGLMLVGLGRAEAVAGSSGASERERELAFWCFLGALPLYAMGAGVALFEGVDRLSRPLATTGSRIELALSGIAAAAAVGIAWAVWRRIDRMGDGRDATLLEILRGSGNAPLLAVLIQSVAAYTAALVGICGIVASRHAGIAIGEGGASIAIGLVMLSVAAAMAIEVKRLLFGVGTVRSVAMTVTPGAAALETTSIPRPQVSSAEQAPVVTEREPEEAVVVPTGAAVVQLKPQIMARPRSAKKRHGKRRR